MKIIGGNRMRLLLIGVGGVGQSAVMIIKRAGNKGKWLEKMIMADYDLQRAKEVEKIVDDERFIGEKLNAASKEDIIAMVKKYKCTFRKFFIIKYRIFF